MSKKLSALFVILLITLSAPASAYRCIYRGFYASEPIDGAILKGTITELRYKGHRFHRAGAVNFIKNVSNGELFKLNKRYGLAVEETDAPDIYVEVRIAASELMFGNFNPNEWYRVRLTFNRSNIPYSSFHANTDFYAQEELIFSTSSEKKTAGTSHCLHGYYADINTMLLSYQNSLSESLEKLPENDPAFKALTVELENSHRWIPTYLGTEDITLKFPPDETYQPPKGFQGLSEEQTIVRTEIMQKIGGEPCKIHTLEALISHRASPCEGLK